MIFHQFSYGPDSERSVESLRSIRRLYPTAPIYLWEDARKPVNPSLDYSGAMIRSTTFRRMGNLNGPECVLGMQECYKIGYDENPQETGHVKIDSDGVIVSPDKLRELVESEVYFFCPALSNVSVYGWFQYQSRAFAEEYRAVKNIRAICRQPSWNEDLVFHEAACLLANGRPVRDFKVPGNRDGFPFYPYDGTPLADWRDNTAVMFGAYRTSDRLLVARTMHQFVSELPCPE